MQRFRFTIASLLLVILFAAVGFAALRESSDLWEIGVFSLTLAVMLISILLGVHRRESRRAFWLGFALLGWVYLGLSLVPSIESRLMTTKALTFLDSKVPGRSPALRLYATINSGTGGNQAQSIRIGKSKGDIAIHGGCLENMGGASILGPSVCSYGRFDKP